MYLFYSNNIIHSGQHINVTVVDFGIWNRLAEVFCDNLAIISEPLTLHETTLCAGPQRVKHAYLSTTSTIDVVISPNIQNSHFLLKYEGMLLFFCTIVNNLLLTLHDTIKVLCSLNYVIEVYFYSYCLVVGCPEVIAPPYSQVNIDGDIAVVTCAAVDASWELRCVDKVWTGGEDVVKCLPGV